MAKTIHRVGNTDSKWNKGLFSLCLLCVVVVFRCRLWKICMWLCVLNHVTITSSVNSNFILLFENVRYITIFSLFEVHRYLCWIRQNIILCWNTGWQVVHKSSSHGYTIYKLSSPLSLQKAFHVIFSGSYISFAWHQKNAFILEILQ